MAASCIMLGGQKLARALACSGSLYSSVLHDAIDVEEHLLRGLWQALLRMFCLPRWIPK